MRPPLVREVEQYNSYQMQRLLVTPGFDAFLAGVRPQ